MYLTVAICTWNRAALLEQTLEQMTRLELPPGIEWELIVVNNNSTDATDEVLARFDGRLPLRRLFEPKPGQSQARNLAVHEAKGEYILWTDDDVLVSERWIAEYAESFGRRPEAAIFGGPIEPWFTETPPGWLLKALPRLHGAYAVRDLGTEPLRFSHVTQPFGANMVVRVREQRRHLFNPGLGLSWARPGSELRSEESTVFQQIMSEGGEGWWVPGARVRHHIARERQRTSYLRKYFLGYGEYLGMVDPDENAPRVFGRPLWLWRQALEQEGRYRLSRLFASPEVWIEDLISSSTTWGQIRGYAHSHDPTVNNIVRARTPGSS